MHERVGACLEDDADDADGAGDALQSQSLVELAVDQNRANGVGQRDEIGDAGDDVIELVLIEFQSFHDGGGDAVFLGSCEVFSVGGEDVVGMRRKRSLDCLKRGIPQLDGRSRHLRARKLHITGDVGNCGVLRIGHDQSPILIVGSLTV